MGFFDKMFSGLTKTRKNIEDLEEVFRNYDIDSEDFYDELEEMLIMADVGGETTAQIMMDYKRILLRRYINKGKAAKEAFVGYMQDMLGNMDTKLKLDTKPSVILMVGVNGVGKTTTIGKLAASLKAEGKNPFTLDSKEPDWSKFQDFLKGEVRFASVAKQYPAEAAELFAAAEENAKWRLRSYKRMAAENWDVE